MHSAWLIRHHATYIYPLHLYYNLCTGVDSSPPEAPSITTSPRSQSVGPNDKVVLSCTATGSPTPSIRWYKDNIPITGPQAVGSDLVIPEAIPNDRGIYQCEAFSSFGTSSRSFEALILIKSGKVTILNSTETERPRVYECITVHAGIVQFHVHIDFGSKRKRQANANIIETVSNRMPYTIDYFVQACSHTYIRT